ncbi:hypothetical protein MKEN_00704600 [Mycena kentingensis (nom. inval.)]|nr:hypothetical protein MKEN_00704600 [Mycena kentingensis (nom. inval.)]
MPSGIDPTDYRAFYPYTPNEVKHRKRTTSAQLKVLEGIFKRDTKPNAALRTELAAQLSMTARGVQVWFQNRRAKEKNKAAKAAKSKDVDSSEDGETRDRDRDQQRPDSPSEVVPSLSSSTSPSPTTASPPQLHLMTDANASLGLPLDSPALETPDDEVPALGLHSMRRGSLPVAVYGPPLVDPLDPLARRRSVDASLIRLGGHPFAPIARAKNNALLATQRLSQGRQPQGPARGMFMRPGMPHRTTVPMQQQPHTRHASMDARGYRVPQSPSPSPLSPFHAVRDQHLYVARNIPAPIPGPLPNPAFSFGVASAGANASAESSEHNSPVDFSGFSFGRNDTDTDDEGSAYQMSRFGSIASESSTTSAYYSDLGSNSGDIPADFRRRESCPTGFLNMMSGLDVNAHRRASLAEGLLGGYHHPSTDAGDRDASVGRYPSPSSTVVSARSSPHLSGQPQATSSSSELNYALKHPDYQRSAAIDLNVEPAADSNTFFYDANTNNNGAPSYPVAASDADSKYHPHSYDFAYAVEQGDVQGSRMPQYNANAYYEPHANPEPAFAYS